MKWNSAATSTTKGAEMACPVDFAVAVGSRFARFAKLPVELQMMVWELAIEKLPARVVVVTTRFRERHMQCSSRTPLAGLLRACKAARKMALKLYSAKIELENRTIRLDGDKDILLLVYPEGGLTRVGALGTAHNAQQEMASFYDFLYLQAHDDRFREDPKFVVKGVKRLAICERDDVLLEKAAIDQLGGRKDRFLFKAFPDLQECFEVRDSRVPLEETMQLLQYTDQDVLLRPRWIRIQNSSIPKVLKEDDVTFWKAEVLRPYVSPWFPLGLPPF
ncbi:hypothetical protein WAI453_001771 [Rhynchosporium graminicola]|uniref:2EXR domain-containing protein n=1 Tax=Rhynchosporium graminicola TaxID=2792576 RepID=A0A1E1LPH4_9HELO|nr:uncharacterized protein RCO7_09092 [Rhynchosporium commune]